MAQINPWRFGCFHQEDSQTWLYSKSVRLLPLRSPKPTGVVILANALLKRSANEIDFMLSLVSPGLETEKFSIILWMREGGRSYNL